MGRFYKESGLRISLSSGLVKPRREQSVDWRRGFARDAYWILIDGFSESDQPVWALRVPVSSGEKLKAVLGEAELLLFLTGHLSPVCEERKSCIGLLCDAVRLRRGRSGDLRRRLTLNLSAHCVSAGVDSIQHC